MIFGVLYIAGRRHDARMLRNGIFLVAMFASAALALLLGLALSVPAIAVIISLLVALLIPLAGFILAVVLIVNGVQMMRLEGRSISNLLSFMAGFLLLLVPAALVGGVALASDMKATDPAFIALFILELLLFLVPSYFAVSFVTFTVYSIVYSRTRHRMVPDAIVVLGSGLIRGQVPPLLRSRLDRALQSYAAERAMGRVPLLIPSGGQGHDEPRSEGAAMAEYLITHGALSEHVLPETASRNTQQNLSFSRKVQLDAGRDGQIMVVTNNYHVLRTAVLARKLDLPAQVVGSRTARYYVPSAFLREFIAVTVEHRWLNVAACAPFVLLALYPLIEYWNGQT